MIRIGIIGTGGMGLVHGSAFEKIRGCAVTACCDIDAERAAWFANRFQVPRVYTDFRELLATADIDAITTAAPPRPTSTGASSRAFGQASTTNPILPVARKSRKCWMHVCSRMQPVVRCVYEETVLRGMKDE